MALDVERIQFSVPFELSYAPQALKRKSGDSAIMALGYDGEFPQLAIYSPAASGRGYESLSRLELSQHYAQIDKVEVSGDEWPVLVDSEGVVLVDDKGVKRLWSGSHLYKIAPVPFIRRTDMSADLNGDGREDLWLADIHHTTVLLQQGDGSFLAQQIPVAAKMLVEGDYISYVARPIYSADSNGDGAEDLMAVVDSQLHVFTQGSDGRFAAEPVMMALPEGTFDREWWEVRQHDGDSLNQADMRHRTVAEIEDMNGDGLFDLVVRHSSSSGVLDRRNDYEVFYGSNAAQVRFADEPDTVIRADGTLSGLRLEDINNNGRKEVLLSRFDIGISQLVSALLSSSMRQDLLSFSQNDSGKYGEKPSAQYKVKLEFSLSSGKRGEPVIRVGDIDGDGTQDLLLSSGKEQLLFHSGNGDARLFERRGSKIKVDIPEKRSMVRLLELGPGEREDIVLAYRGEQSGDDSRILILRPSQFRAKDSETVAATGQ